MCFICTEWWFSLFEPGVQWAACKMSMVLLASVVRVRDGLPLSASTDYEQDKGFQETQKHLKGLSKKLGQFPDRCSLRSGLYNIKWVIIAMVMRLCVKLSAFLHYSIVQNINIHTYIHTHIYIYIYNRQWPWSMHVLCKVFLAKNIIFIWNNYWANETNNTFWTMIFAN